jgi:hypothetical protein
MGARVWRLKWGALKTPVSDAVHPSAASRHPSSTPGCRRRRPQRREAGGLGCPGIERIRGELGTSSWTASPRSASALQLHSQPTCARPERPSVVLSPPGRRPPRACADIAPAHTRRLRRRLQRWLHTRRQTGAGTVSTVHHPIPPIG